MAIEWGVVLSISKIAKKHNIYLFIYFIHIVFFICFFKKFTDIWIIKLALF